MDGANRDLREEVDMNRLRMARIRALMSQKDLAEASGVHQTTISDIENQPEIEMGNISRYRTLTKLAGALGIPVEDLLEDAVPAA
jgi:transcriptional regulator with XRE-family HTH domain